MANATIITAGSLTHDTDTDIISDALGLDWHTLDYNNTIIGDGTITYLINTRLALGGDLYGWEIAKQADYYQMLVNAGAGNIQVDLLDDSSSSNRYVGVIMNNIHLWFEMFKLGDSYTSVTYLDHFLVNMTNDDLFNINNLKFVRPELNTKIIRNSSGSGSQYYNKSESLRMSIMLSRVAVPEPSTLAIFALGMFGLASRRFKKQ